MFVELCYQTLISTFILVVLTWLWYKKPSNYPPGPYGWPVVGVFPYLSRYPEREFSEWSKKYGPVLSVRMAWSHWVVIHSYDAIIEALTKNSEAFSGRPLLSFFKKVYRSNLGLTFSPGGYKTKKMRNCASRALKSFKKQHIEDMINEEIQFCVEEIRNEHGKPFIVQDVLTNMVGNAVCRLMFGHRLEYNDKRLTEMVNGVVKLFELCCKKLSFLYNVVPVACSFPFPPVSTHIEETRQQLITIEAHIKNLMDQYNSSSEDRNHKTSIYATFREDEGKFSESDALYVLRDIIIGGTEIPSATLRWGLLCMTTYPECQRKCQQEIDDVLGPDRSPSMGDRPDLPYVCATVQEIYRYKVIAPLGLPRMTTQEVKIQGYTIPKNTNIFVNLWDLHNDPKFWKEPEKFLPERHLDENGKFVPSSRIMPFMTGSRGCIAQDFARVEVFLLFITLLQKFTVELDPDDDDPPTLDTIGVNGTNYVPLPFNVIMQSR